MTQYTGGLIESQVDWLTVSAHGERQASNMLDLALSLAKEERDHGARRRPFRLMGYNGYHVGRVEYGQRDKASTIMRLIGDSANEHLAKALSVADDVTRIDLAVTYRDSPPDPYHGRNAYTLAEQHWRKNPQRATPWTTNDAKGGYTLYIGKRESENFFRLYNKEAECIATDDTAGALRYAGCWRYELESKGGLAHNLADTVNDQEDRASYVATYLHNYSTAHGLEPPFPAAGSWTLLPGFRRRSDEETKLRHLARNVAPTVRWLRKRGREQELLKALGLGDSDQTLTEH